MPVERIYTEDEVNARHVDVQWGKAYANVSVGAIKDEPDKSEPSGLFVDLTHRHHVNRLIAVLRKARDQAFGRDE